MNEFSSAELKITQLLQGILQATRLDLTFAIKEQPGAVPLIAVELAGPDTPLLIHRNGELLRAVEHLTAKVLQLEPEQHDLLSFDADRFKQKRDAALAQSAKQAVVLVRETGRPFNFAPMSSHERRRLHLALASSGLRTTSTGEGPQRAVVLYPDQASSNN